MSTSRDDEAPQPGPCIHAVTEAVSGSSTSWRGDACSALGLGLSGAPLWDDPAKTLRLPLSLASIRVCSAGADSERLWLFATFNSLQLGCSEGRRCERLCRKVGDEMGCSECRRWWGVRMGEVDRRRTTKLDGVGLAIGDLSRCVVTGDAGREYGQGHRSSSEELEDELPERRSARRADRTPFGK